MERLARLVLRHKGRVALAWLLLFVAGVAAAGPVSQRLTFDFSLPGQPGYEAERQLIAAYGTGTFDTFVPVVTVPTGSSVEAQRQAVEGVFAQVRRELPQLRVVDLGSTGDPRFVTKDGRSAFGLVQGPEPAGFGPGIEVQLAPSLERAAGAAGLQVGLTSYNLLAAGGDSSDGPSVLAETLLGGLGALAVLAFVFASWPSCRCSSPRCPS